MRGNTSITFHIAVSLQRIMNMNNYAPVMATIYDVRAFYAAHKDLPEPIIKFTCTNDEISTEGMCGLFDSEYVDKKTGFKKIRAKKRIKLSNFTDYLVNPRNLVQCVFRDSMRTFLRGKSDFRILRPQDDTFAAYVLSEVFITRMSSDCGPLDPMKFSMSSQTLNKKLKNFFNHSEFLLNKLDMLDKAHCTEICISAKCLHVNSYDEYIYGPLAASLNSINMLVSTLADRNQFKVIHGRAGCGKTYSAVNGIASGSCVAVISLSNNIAVKTAATLNKKGISADALSNTAATYMFMVNDHGNCIAQKRGYSYILIDEFSQWGLWETDLLESILGYAEFTHAPVCIMGDELQIPSFLGRGSFLYSFLRQFPSRCEELKINHRNGDPRMTTLAQKFLENDTIFPLVNSPFTISGEEVSNVIGNNENDFDDFVIVTGSRQSVNFFNYLCACTVANVIPDFTEGMYDSQSFMNEHFDSIMHACATGHHFRLRAGETFRLTTRLDSSESLKIRGNEEFIMHTLPVTDSRQKHPNVSMCSVLDDKRAFVCSYSDMMQFFDLAYAITVNRSQGLEWGSVLVIMGEIRATDSRTGEEFTSGNNYNLTGSEEGIYVSISRARKSMKIFIGNTGIKKLSKLPVINLFAECN